MPQPPELDDLADPLVAAYRRAWYRIVAEWDTVAADPVRHARARRLGELARATAAEMRRLDGRADEWLRLRFPRAYAAGMTAQAAAGEAAWTLAHQEAVERLAGDLFGDLLRATSGVDDSVKALVRAVGRDQALASAIEGRTARQSAREMRRILNEQGLYSVVYRDGSRHGLGEYTDMAIRTKTAVAYNEGTIGQHGDIRFFEVFDGPSCGWSAHDDTTQALGLIVDRDEARAFPVAHPNCRRAFGPRPDVVDLAAVRDLERNPMTVGAGQTTFAQREAQLAQDRTRQASQRRQRNRRARAARRAQRTSAVG